jgi:HAE1 family hydrophobic/amphiphilic exporter-1
MDNAEAGGMQAEVSLRLEGDDAGVLRVQADKLVADLEAIPGVLDAGTDAERADPELQLRIDPQLAGLAGVNPTVAAQTVAFALQGTKLSSLKQGDREIEVWSQFGEMDRAGLSNLENINVMGNEGRSVPLNQIMTVTRGQTPQVINRIDGKNYLWVQVQAASKDLRTIREGIIGAIAEFELPPGYRIAMGDEFQNMEEDQRNFASILLLALILIYIVMAALFESYLLPLSILTTVPLAFLGVYWVLFITRTSMDTVAFIGCILMVGVVVNNGIVIVDRINQLRAGDMPRFEAILQGGRDRLRPVLMTAITTILGSMPLAIGPPLGDPAAVSLGRAMIGGLIGGTFLTLFVVPLFYALIDDFRGWSMRFAADLLPSRNKPQ